MICRDDRLCTLFCIIMIPEALSIQGVNQGFLDSMDVCLFVYLYDWIVLIIHILKHKLLDL